MGVRPGSKSCIEKTAEFAVEKFCLSLGQGREPSNLQCSGLAVAHNRKCFRADARLKLVPLVLGHQTRCHGEDEDDHFRHQCREVHKGRSRAEPWPPRTRRRSCPHGAERRTSSHLRLACRSAGRLIPVLATRYGRAHPGHACLWTDILIHFERGRPCRKKRSRRRNRKPS
jgi:hypothetical protein